MLFLLQICYVYVLLKMGHSWNKILIDLYYLTRKIWSSLVVGCLFASRVSASRANT